MVAMWDHLGAFFSATVTAADNDGWGDGGEEREKARGRQGRSHPARRTVAAAGLITTERGRRRGGHLICDDECRV